MWKKFLTLSIALIIVLSSFGVSNVFAEDGNLQEISHDVLEQNASQIADYDEYITVHSDSLNSNSTIAVKGIDYEESKGADVEIASLGSEQNEALMWTNEAGSINWNIAVNETGLYIFELTYYTLPGRDQPIELGILIDNSYPFSQCQNISFHRYWKDDGDLRTDSKGNEFSPEQSEVFGWYTQPAQDVSGRFSKPFMFYLEAGAHTITLQSVAEPLAIGAISFTSPPQVNDYASLQSGADNAEYYDGEPIIIEGEDAALKSDNSLVSQSDNTSAEVYPSDAYINKVNYIGGNNWSQQGDMIEWEVNVPKAGYYVIGFKYRQKYTLNATFYRNIKIDGKTAFSESEQIPFAYSRSWSYFEPTDSDKNPYLFYFDTEGTHRISLEVTSGPMADICNRSDDVVYDLASLYRSIVMITGDTPDANRNYNLFSQISGFEDQLRKNISNLNGIAADVKEIMGGKSTTAISIVNNIKNVLELMLDNKYSAHKYKDRYYSTYTSFSAWLNEIGNMPLDIDRIVLRSPDKQYDDTTGGLWKSINHSVTRFLTSFISDYTDEDAENNNEEELTLWVNWGRDQAKVLQYLVQSDFSAKYDVNVKIKITNATIQHAVLSGNGPDCMLHLSRTEPMNLAMRGALYDLRSFDDCDEVMKQFMPSAGTPYEFQGGLYALPDTQSFYMMFYRTDIFEQLGLSVPKTWDDFISASSIIMRKNMQVGLPYTQITTMTQVNLGVGSLNIFPTLLIQKGAPLYNDTLSATNLLSPTSVEAFVEWTDYYNKYNFPLTYDFFNRFRVGSMPLGIQSYAMYATLSAAAPEISGCWEMVPIPGYEQPDGSICNIEAGGGTGAVILNQSKNKAAAWEFLKWWTSADIQYKYGREVETLLGSSARNLTANVEALKRLPWRSETLSLLIDQWKQVEELPQVPGGYFISRVVDQAFLNTVNSKEDAKDMLVKWNKIADLEIARKRKQYNVS